MTAKQKVLRAHPEARSRENKKGLLYRWWIYPDATLAFSIGAGADPRSAWRDAALNLSARR